MSIIHRLQNTVSCADPMQRLHTAARAQLAYFCIAQCFEEGYYQIDIKFNLNHLSGYDLWWLTVGSIH